MELEYALNNGVKVDYYISSDSILKKTNLQSQYMRNIKTIRMTKYPYWI